MHTRTPRAVLWLSVAGIAFSGVLTLLYYNGLCTGGCTILFSLPSCVYGLALFLLLAGFALAAPVWRHALLWIFGVAVFGALFSLTLAIIEMLECVFCYQLGLPNCAYGFVVFSVIAGLSFNAVMKDIA